MTEPTFLIKTETEDDRHGLFVFEPLEQGYGQTLGNSIRRVLLTSLPGSAVESVKIEGAKHQFSSIEGLKESVVDLILNIKKIRLIIEDDEEVTLKLNKKGPGIVQASDIEVPAGVKIVNPDLVLGTLSDKKTELVVKMTAKRGYGYVMANEKSVEEIGVIPLDALYSPVFRVNYKVESTRVGRMTNLDKLVMEIWTDGTIKPGDALKMAAQTLMSYFHQIFEPKIVKKEEELKDENVISDEILKMRIEELDIPTRIVNALANGGIETISQLMTTPRSDLMKIKNLGVKSISIVEEKVKEKGVRLEQ